METKRSYTHRCVTATITTASTSKALDVASLYDAHGRVVWRTLARLGVAPSQLEDALQEVFLTAFQRRESFEQRAQEKTWLIGIAVRVAANARRRRSNRDTTPLETKVVFSTAPAADESLDAQRQLAALDAALRELPAEQRDVLVLHDLERLTAPVIAEAVGAKLATVYSRLRLARQALARTLRPSEEDPS